MNRSRVRLARPGLSSGRRGCRPVPERLEERSLLSTFTVVNTDDGGPGSLRQAILGANALAGLDTIDFNFPRAGRYTIMPLSGLPSIDDPVTIDGTTQPGYAGVPFIELDGSRAATEVGLSLSGGSTVRGLVINRFALGVLLSGGGGNRVEGNYIGTDLTGNQAAGNLQNGIEIVSSSANVIGGTTAAARNVIAGNGRGGIEVNGTGNTIEGNYIGLGADGATALGNTRNGIHLLNSQNTIGGIAPGAGNVISGNGLNGIHDEDGSGIIIQGNFIGTDATGLIAVGNHGDGVKTEPGGDVIGGTDPGAGNLISGNGQAGIEMSSSLVQGNKIGTNVNGDAALGNVGPGIRVHGFLNTIGGAPAGAGNLVSGNLGDGIVLEADENTIKGNRIGTTADGASALGNGGAGVVVLGARNLIGGTELGERNLVSANKGGGLILASDNTVKGNRIGTTADGAAALGNVGDGLLIRGAGNLIGGTSNLIGGTGKGSGPGNIISGNIGHGVYLSGAAASGNQLFGNLIGTDRTGTVALGNTEGGLWIEGANNVIGAPEGRNVISGNGDPGQALIEFRGGVRIRTSAASGNVLRSNHIGTDITGTKALANFGDGIAILDAANTQIGGTGAGEGNLISGNGLDGIGVGGSSTNTLIEGNLIGTNRAGTAAVANGQGVYLYVVDSVVTVGGTTPGAGNVISGNHNGLHIESPDLDPHDFTVVQGNLIGTQIDGHSPLGNAQFGIESDTWTKLTVGAAFDTSTSPNAAGTAANTIAYNGGPGIFTNSEKPVGITFLANSIYANVGLGIDSYPGGVNPNDPGDADHFGNAEQNYPVLTSAKSNNLNTTVRGTLNSTPNGTFRVEFFANDEPDVTRYGEGQEYLGAVMVTTDASGNANIVASLKAVPSGRFISATATKSGVNTSEFSQVIEVNPPNTSADLSVSLAATPEPALAGGHLTYTITVTNHGPNAAHHVALSDSLPTEASFRSASGGGMEIVGGAGDNRVVFSIGTLASGASAVETIDTSLFLFPNGQNTTSTIIDSATVTEDEPDPNTSNDSATVSTMLNPIPVDLNVTVTVSSDPVAPGDTLTYTITATVLSPSPSTGTGIVVKDTLPTGVTFVSASSAAASESGGVVTFPIASLPHGSTKKLTIVVRANVSGPITNTVTITTANQPDPDLSNNTAMITTTVTAPPSGSGITATTNPNDQVAPQRGGPSGTTQSFSLTFSAALDPARAVDLRNYHLFAMGQAGVFGVSTGREILLRSAAYNPTTHAVTLTPRRRIPSGQFFEVKVDGTSRHGVSDLSGRLIDGNGDGRPGGDYVAILARGRRLRYRERDGDLVGLRLAGGGVLELHQRADGTVPQVRIVGAVPGRSELHGIVLRFRRGGDGRTAIGAITGLGGVRDLLAHTRFFIG